MNNKQRQRFESPGFLEGKKSRVSQAASCEGDKQANRSFCKKIS